ncbi:phage portal protein [Staphylococcus succinus]|uniref:phage portal protein n=1 Tax=Staphylococcus succinus TaxID=61015 RepID=UPI00301E4CB1
MGIFYKSETRSTNYVDSNAFDAFPVGSIPISALNWDEQQALMSSDIFTAVTTLAKDISKLDIRVQENGVYRERDSIEYLLNKRPNKIYNGTQLKFIVMMSALLNGKGYILIERNPLNQIQSLHHIQTSRVRLKEDENNFYYELSNDGKNKRVPFEDMLVIMPYSTDGINAITALASLQDDINNQQFGKKFFTNFFANGSNAGSVLKMKDGKLSQEARDKIKRKWIEANSGSDKVNSVIVLDETMEFDKLEIKTEILDIINKNTASTRAIAKAFGLPLSKLGIEQTNTSLQDALNDYLMNTLGSYMKVWTSELDFKLIQDKDKYTRQFVFDTTAFRTVDWQKHVETLNTQLDKGGITLDEYRKGLGLPPVPSGLGANHRVDLNHIDLDLADDFQLREVTTNNQATKAVSEDADSSATLKGGENDEQEGI